MQIKTAMKYHLTLVRMAVIKSLQAINAVDCIKKREPPCTTVGNLGWCNHYGEPSGDSLQN